MRNFHEGEKPECMENVGEQRFFSCNVLNKAGLLRVGVLFFIRLGFVACHLLKQDFKENWFVEPAPGCANMIQRLSQASALQPLSSGYERKHAL